MKRYTKELKNKSSLHLKEGRWRWQHLYRQINNRMLYVLAHDVCIQCCMKPLGIKPLNIFTELTINSSC